MIKSLRRNFIAIAMCSISLVLAIIMAAVNAANYINVCQSADQRIRLIAENGGTLPQGLKLTEPAFFDEPGRSFDLGRRELSEETFFDTRFFTVTVSEDGSVLSVNTGKIAAISTSDAADYASGLWRGQKETGFIDEYRYQSVSALSDSGEAATMYIFLYAGRELDSFHNFLIASVGVSLFGLLLVFLLVLFLSKKALAPVAESYEKQKRFITDASHEIKTPLTIIDANTEVLEMTEGESQWTRSIKNQVARLTSLTEKLVFLSRMDEENEKPDLIDFDLSEAVLDAAEPFFALAASKERTLTLDVASGIKLKGDEATLRQLISLLLDNAVKYSNEKGSIRLELKQSGKTKSAVLRVKNTTEPMPAGRHDELFERFYRPDASRSSRTGGFGIGLSVAKAIVNAHHGRITAKSEDGASLTFTVTLPLS